MKSGIVAALVGSAAAAAHQGHNGFHLRRYVSEEGVCTVYTTVYVTASAVPVPSSAKPSAIPTTSLYSALSSASISVPPLVPTISSVSVPAPVPSSPSAYVPVPVPSSSKPAPVPSTSSEKPTPVPSTSEKPVPVPSTSSTPAPVPSSSSKPPAAPSSTKSEAPKPTGGSSYSTNLVPNGQKLSITYTPYASNGQCMSASQVQTDIAKIAGLGYPAIRVYSTDCGVFENVVPAATKHGLKITYGIFLDAAKGPGSAGANEQLNAIIKNAPKDSFAMLIVGNEYISGHGGSAATLAPYIKTCKEKLVAAGFPSTIPVTTTETVGAIEKYGKAWCDSIDVLAAQIHPFFDGGVSASGAGEFAVKQLAQAAKICPEAAARGTYITEIGWPTGGQDNGAAIPGVSQQKEAIASIVKSVGDKATLFSWQNDDWKDPGSFGVEQKFGCASALS